MNNNNQHKKIKTVHVHSDYKFVSGTKRFEGKYFDNTVIILQREEAYNGPYQDAAKFFDKKQIDEVIEICKTADLVVLYDLDVLKSEIALSLPKNIKVAWRFFGYELYKRMKNEILSSKTKLCLTGEGTGTVLNRIKGLLRPTFYKLKYGRTLDEQFQQAVNRVNYMLMISQYEHAFLSNYWENLPGCIELPLRKEIFLKDISSIPIMSSKDNKIVIGNNRSIYNNHFDIFVEIEKAFNKENYQFELLFNYGKEDEYAIAVKKAVQGKPYFYVIEDFMAKEEFNTFYDDVSALVINGYRQMAMGNIFHALKHGVKVYLNEKNVMMDWLLDNGIKVYSISSLSDDIEKRNIRLDQQTANENLKCLNDLYSRYSHEEFQSKIFKITT